MKIYEMNLWKLMRTHEELWKLMKNWANLARIVKRTVGTGQLSSSTNVSVNFPNFPTFQKARLRSKKAILASLALAPGLDSSRSTPVASYTLEWTSEYTDSETTRSESYIFSYLITAAVNLAFYWMFGFLLSELWPQIRNLKIMYFVPSILAILWTVSADCSRRRCRLLV